MSDPVCKQLTETRDAETVNTFFNRMLDEQFASTFPAAALEAYRHKYSVEALVERIRSGRAVIAGLFDREALIGLVIGGPPNGGVASLDWVVVAPGYQGRGLGRRLVQFAFQAYHQQGAHKVVLYTETESARHFYEKCGMTCEGVHPRHWWDVTHYCMGCILEGDSRQAEGSGQ